MTPATVSGEEIQIPWTHRVVQLVPHESEHPAIGTVKLVFSRDVEFPEVGKTVAMTIEEVD